MTRKSQKNRELAFVETAKSLLGFNWEIELGAEPPDFNIAEGRNQFGLEVTQVFKGSIGRGGSEFKKTESFNAKKVNELRAQFQRASSLQMRVKFLGNLNTPRLSETVQIILGQNFENREYGQNVEITSIPGLKIVAHRAFVHDWSLINDAVGWVVPNGASEIQKAISATVEHLKVGDLGVGQISKILVVADRRTNSGKLLLDRNERFDFLPFVEAYFLSYPDGPCVALSGRNLGPQ